MPRVSVIVPAYNAQAVLAQTLESVHAQRYRDWEIVVADDGSSDRTAEIARSFDRVTVVATEGRLGPAGARNRALEAAGGELMALLDADDLWEPELLSEQVACYDAEEAREPGVGVVACDARILQDGRMQEHTYADEFGRPDGVTLTTLLTHNPILACGALTPLGLVRDLGGFDPATWGSEDHELWLRIVERGRRIVSNPRALAIYRRGAASVSADAIGMARTNQVTLRRALERGRLDPGQARIARRELRLHEAIERVALARDGRSPAHLARAVPALARVAAENPHRWRRWARRRRMA
ncbi:MAG TPA: glycosyltransferase family A protein [Capillimicrobium sp.]